MNSALFDRVRSHRIHHLAVIILLLWTLAISPLVAARAAAAPSACSDVEIVFARGTFEAPGVGATGQAFVDALTPRLGGASVDVYPVNYPASLDFQAAASGITDAGNRIQYIANSCPTTKIVLGGYSQGAAVAGYTTFDAVPAGLALPPGLTGPMPPAVAPHVAAVALFGTPDNWFLNLVDRNAPPITVGPLYAAKTIQLCASGDPVCAPGGLDRAAHSAYKTNGMAVQAADFVAAALDRAPSSD
ncbi:cutinase family protein [Mycolicibacterium sp. 22603]|uniref:cutinase family protein n=1 Tax=Mycolicibacterium sp. 22603 TaxID=3453950 RepID=UPI003F862CCA